jgi:hypothetical protein
MSIHRVWVEILILATAVACVLAIVFATVGAAAGAAESEVQPPQSIHSTPVLAVAVAQEVAEQTYQGMVTCSKCGAKHSSTMGQSASDCVRVCVADGAKFSLVDGEDIYLLDGDSLVLKKVAGRRARVIGAMRGKTITVSSVAAEI